MANPPELTEFHLDCEYTNLCSRGMTQYFFGRKQAPGGLFPCSGKSLTAVHWSQSLWSDIVTKLRGLRTTDHTYPFEHLLFTFRKFKFKSYNFSTLVENTEVVWAKYDHNLYFVPSVNICFMQGSFLSQCLNSTYGSFLWRIFNICF
jgi:hypothetical protein